MEIPESPLGDSSHTMVPFHAIGMITGLEDVRFFFEDFIDPRSSHLPCPHKGLVKKPFCPPGVVQRHTEYRQPGVHAMTDMAVEHYHELRVGVKSRASSAKEAVKAVL